MARLIICAQDTISSLDARDTVHEFKRGDVVSVQADDWEPSKRVMQSPRLTIVDLPGVSVEEARKYVEPEIDEVEEKAIALRKWQYDLSRLGSGELPKERGPTDIKAGQ